MRSLHCQRGDTYDRESPVARVLREGGIVGLANHTVLIARDGTEVPIDDSAAPVQGSDGTIQGTVLVFRDITERRHAEQQIVCSPRSSNSRGMPSSARI